MTPGDKIPGVRFDVYKVRARNSDSAKGKSGGYRIIYQRTLQASIILITIYSKTEQEDISPEEIRDIITHYEEEQADLNHENTRQESAQDNPEMPATSETN